MAYILSNEDIATLQKQNDAAIAVARKNDSTTDDEMAHLFQLRGKLNKIAEGRGEEEKTASPQKTTTRSTRKSSSPAPASASASATQ